MIKLFGFLLVMWVLILLGGAVAILVLDFISVSGYGEFDSILTNAARIVIAITLIVVWVFILSKLKNVILKT